MTDKSTHTIVLDAGPIIKNEPSISSLLAQSECLVTTPTVISEIRDAAARARVETTLRPFLTLRTPTIESYRIVTQFAKKTGDFSVLSKADLEIIALAYDLECERNGGDWRLRSVPGQKKLNGPPPRKESENLALPVQGDLTAQEGQIDISHRESTTAAHSAEPTEAPNEVESKTSDPPGPGYSQQSTEELVSEETQNDCSESLAQETSQLQVSSSLADHQSQHTSTGLEAGETLIENDFLDSTEVEQAQPQESEEDLATASGSDSDSEGWITPSNLKKHQEQDAAGRNSSTDLDVEQSVLQVATITTDYALQNVLLQMNLNLLSTGLHRIRHLKTFVLRCHACFNVCKDTTKQFCPRCGKPTLTRVSCSTSQNGEFKLHLKKNFQYNTRGDRYSIPKPQASSASGRTTGGGQGGWGHQLILAPDQKEYERAITVEKRQKMKDLMDEDYLPSILSGDRQRQGGRPKVGAGRHVNSRKRKT